MKANTKAQRSNKAWGRYALVLLLAMLGIVAVSTSAFADESKPNWSQSITYIDENGDEQTKEFFVVSDDYEWLAYLDSGSQPYKYVALKGDWNFPNLEFFSETEALVIMDGCNVGTSQMTIHGAKSAVDRQFKIYGQKDGTGRLLVSRNGGGADFVALNAFNDSFSDGAPTPRLSMYGGNIDILVDSGRAIQVERGADSAGEMEIAGGKMTATSKGVYGAEIGSSLLVTGGTFESTGAQGGIVVHGGCDIRGGTTTATATKDAGVGLLVESSPVFTDGAVNATGPGGGIVFNNRSMDIGSFVIKGGNVTGTCTGVGVPGTTDGPGIGSDRTGSLPYQIEITGGTVTGTSVNGAGIGGSENDTAIVEVSVEGGIVTGASSAGAGIGVGSNTTSNKCSVTIKGGTVTATSRSGAGIGSGDSCAPCGVTIMGGTVEKAESLTGAGIGGGFGGEGCVVYIEGGTVNAYANEDASGFLSAGAAIGGGSSSENYMVYISGADTKVTATAESGAGIGGGDSADTGYVSISGGTVYATSNGTGACIGSAYNGGACTVDISGGKVYAGLYDGGGQTDGAGIGGGEAGNGGKVTISGGEVYARSTKGGAGIGGGYGGAGGSLTVSGGTVVAWSQQDGDGQAIGHGRDGGGSDSLGINYDAAVTAGDDEEHAQYATVSAESDGRKDACRQRWAKISSCDHQDAGTYTVPSPDGSGTEIHCAHCGAYLGMQNRQETIPANSSKPTATLSTAKPSTASSVAASSKSTTPLSRTADPTTSMAGVVGVALVALAIGSALRPE